MQLEEDSDAFEKQTANITKSLTKSPKSLQSTSNEALQSSSASTFDSYPSIGRPAKRRKLVHPPHPSQAVSHSVAEGLEDLAKNGGLKLFCDVLAIMRRDEDVHNHGQNGLQHGLQAPVHIVSVPQRQQSLPRGISSVHGSLVIDNQQPQPNMLIMHSQPMWRPINFIPSPLNHQPNLNHSVQNLQPVTVPFVPPSVSVVQPWFPSTS